MTRRAPLSDELRADFLELLWAYLEGTKGDVMEWPPQSVERQSTPIEPPYERAFLWEIASHAFTLRNSLGEDGGSPP